MQAHRQTLNIIFVVNPLSGGSENEELYSQIKDFCRNNGIIPVIYKMGDIDIQAKLQATLDKAPPDAVVACGGDGTVNLVGSVLLNTTIPLGIIPLGSSNALSRNLKIPQEIISSLRLIREFRSRDIDTLMIEGQPVLHLCDLGLNAKLIKRSQNSSFRGMLTYGWNLVIELFTYSFFKYQVETQKEKVNGKAFSITLTNTRMYGTMAEINPRGKINDGFFEICIVKAFPKLSIFPMIARLFNGTIPASKYTIFIRAREAWISNPQGQDIHIDGEPVKLPEVFRVKMMHNSLRVIVPA